MRDRARARLALQGKQVKWHRTLALPLTIVYRKVDPDSTAPESFEFPQGGKLASDNRWVMMAKLIPWSEFESEYAENFAKSLLEFRLSTN